MAAAPSDDKGSTRHHIAAPEDDRAGVVGPRVITPPEAEASKSGEHRALGGEARDGSIPRDGDAFRRFRANTMAS